MEWAVRSDVARALPLSRSASSAFAKTLEKLPTTKKKVKKGADREPRALLQMILLLLLSP